MDCSNYIEWIASKLDGSLDEAETRELNEHLSVCSRCCAELRLQTRLIEALAEEPPLELPADFTRRVSAKALELDNEPRRALCWDDLVPTLALVGTAVVLLVFRTWLLEPLGMAFRALPEWISLAVSGPLGEGTGADASLFVATLLAALCATWAVREVYATLTE